jgi:ABC-type glycerol-3-phosphate transport system permease component
MGPLTATAIIAMVPVIVFYFVQKALIRGLTMGAINA